MTGGELSLSHHLGDLFGQLQQSESVGDIGTGFPYPCRHILLRQTMVLHKLAHTLCRFYRIQVFAVQVLDEGYLLYLLIGEFPDDGGHFFEPCDGRRAESSFARYDEVSAVGLFDEQQRLQNAVRRDRRRHFFQALVRERLTWLIGIAVDLRDGDLHRGHILDFDLHILFVVGEKRGQPFSAESSFCCHKHLTCLFFGEILPRVSHMPAPPRTSGRSRRRVFRSWELPQA